ncbi:amino acid ABC transporter permease [Anaeromicrobium sediminis]|uniref:ABC transporter permease n=1 Tax=Anaeromicrobium sediminis TaxID=1478221 RepID=A0A267MLS9_9FIRM|nr:amino acid ABC transporter permease [Anaeromicrobium sediminis]PAB60496.1 ABC transporter permease [Anaeromicrobium sediminis]
MINLDFQFIIEIFPKLLSSVHITLSLTLISMFIGIFVGTMLGIIRVYKIKALDKLASIYISFFRGTPLIVQLFILYYGMPQIIPKFAEVSAYMAAFIGLSLNSGAYMAEIIRSSINAIDKGQMEAALSVGMTKWQAMRRIIFPQAFRIAVPGLGNTFVSLLKETSLAFVLGVSEVLAKGKMISAATYKFFETYLAVAIIYWIITLTFTYIQSKIEKRLNTAYS